MRHALAIAACLFGTSAATEETSTAAAGNAGNYLVTQATCGEVGDVILRAQGEITVDEMLLLINLVTFKNGYAAGKGLTDAQAMDEILGGCIAAPDQLFIDVVSQ